MVCGFESSGCIRHEIAQIVMESIKEKAGRYVNAKLTSQRTIGQNVKQGWDCSQIGNEEEEEEEVVKKKTRWFCNVRRMRSWNEEGTEGP